MTFCWITHVWVSSGEAFEPFEPSHLTYHSHADHSLSGSGNLDSNSELFSPFTYQRNIEGEQLPEVRT